MDLLRRVVKKIVRRGIPPRPVPYKYTTEDARRVYELVLKGEMTHSTSDQIVLLEKEFADYTQATYALSTNSGTSALYMACRSIGLGLGDEVIVPAYTFVASAQAVMLNGAIPVFADIDDTFTISPRSVEQHITKRTKAIMVVHMFGNPCQMDEIMYMARKYKLRVIEDCAQAVGARYKGKSVGTIGDVGCFSFNEKKAIPTGQGGMLITSDANIFRSASIIRNTGIVAEHTGMDVVGIGGTLYMTALEAVLARSVLRQLEYLNNCRKRNYGYLLELLESAHTLIRPYRIISEAEPSFSRAAFIIDVKKIKCSRRDFLNALTARGVPAKAFYPTPLYRYTLFRLKYDSAIKKKISFPAYRRLPNAEKFYAGQVAFEFSPYWNSTNIRYIAETIKAVITSKKIS